MFSLFESKAEIVAEQDAVPVWVNDLTVAYHRKPVLWDVDLTLPEGKLIAVVGPNGAGKSTLIKSILGLVPKATGDVRIYGRSYEAQRRLVGYVPQRESVDWDFPVSAADVVAMGLYGKIGWVKPVSRRHREAGGRGAAQGGHGGLCRPPDQPALRVGSSSVSSWLGPWPRMPVSTLWTSRSPVWMWPPKRPSWPLLKELKTAGKTCVVVHHDLQTATSYFDHVVLLNMRVVAEGAVEEVFNEENLKNTYGGKLTLLSQALHKYSQQPGLGTGGTKGEHR